MIDWLTDTLVATGVLMGLVLAVRRPVARWFGPGAAYALWALPMIRLVIPPLVVRPEFVAHFELALDTIGVGRGGGPAGRFCLRQERCL
ncbi:hypothetical protein [Novosphingobium panipatense]|uniref:hypothetical protein n=1 Tax=Novosphingobium panipatense TaxID=428991 RepID=UPI00361E9996